MLFRSFIISGERFIYGERGNFYTLEDLLQHKEIDASCVNIEQLQRIIIPIISKSTCLHTLNLSFIQGSNYGEAHQINKLKAAIEAIPSTTTICFLNLSGNFLCANAENIARSIASLPITKLNFSGNCLFKEIGKNVASALAASSSIKDLDLSNNNLDENAAEVVKLLISSPSLPLETLNLSRNHLGKNSIKVAEKLSKSSTLKSLDLSGTNLTEHAIDVVRILKSSESLHLEILNLSNNKLASNAIHVAGIFSDYNDMKGLDLSYNDISGAELIEVARALSGHKNLQSLNLSYNHTEDSRLEVATILARCKTLHTVISHDDLGELFIQKVIESGDQAHIALILDNYEGSDNASFLLKALYTKYSPHLDHTEEEASSAAGAGTSTKVELTSQLYNSIGKYCAKFSLEYHPLGVVGYKPLASDSDPEHAVELAFGDIAHVIGEASD